MSAPRDGKSATNVLRREERDEPARRVEREEQPRRERARKPAPSSREPEPEADEEGWNGPVPSFLGTGFGG